jgi:hypothetical protein
MAAGLLHIIEPWFPWLGSIVFGGIYISPPLWPSYIGEKEDNICQSTWDKSEVLWRTCLGTHWELGEH